MKFNWLVAFILCVISAQSQSIQVVNAGWVNNLRAVNNDTLYLVNFWATWCKPCVEELPIFEQLGVDVKDKPVKILLVSSDMKKDLTTRLPNFIKDKNIKQQVLFMNETDANVWIELVSKQWSGAIPATWILYPKNNYEYFIEGELTYQQLFTLIHQQLNYNNEK